MYKRQAPFLPFATDEVWSWWQNAGAGHSASIHRASWPSVEEVTDGLDAGFHGLLEQVSQVLVHVRKAKSDAKVSMKAPVESATLVGPAVALTTLRLAERDLKAVGQIQTLNFGEAEEIAIVEVVLVSQPE